MTFESSKTLGGIGAILLFIGVIPFVQYTWIIGIVGVILVLFALRNFANYYRERGIFSNALYGVAVAVLGSIVAGVLAVAVVLSNITDLLMQLYPGWNGEWSTLQGMTPDTTNFDVIQHPSVNLRSIGGFGNCLGCCHNFSILHLSLAKTGFKQIKRGLIRNRWTNTPNRRNNSNSRVNLDVDISIVTGNSFLHS